MQKNNFSDLIPPIIPFSAASFPTHRSPLCAKHELSGLFASTVVGTGKPKFEVQLKQSSQRSRRAPFGARRYSYSAICSAGIPLAVTMLSKLLSGCCWVGQVNCIAI